MYSFGRFGLTICAVGYVDVSIEFQHRRRSLLRPVIVDGDEYKYEFFRKCASTTDTRPANNEILKFEWNKLFVWFVWNADPSSTFKQTELIILSERKWIAVPIWNIKFFHRTTAVSDGFLYNFALAPIVCNTLYRRNYTYEGFSHRREEKTNEEIKFMQSACVRSFWFGKTASVCRFVAAATAPTSSPPTRRAEYATWIHTQFSRFFFLNFLLLNFWSDKQWMRGTSESTDSWRLIFRHACVAVDVCARGSLESSIFHQILCDTFIRAIVITITRHKNICLFCIHDKYI